MSGITDNPPSTQPPSPASSSATGVQKVQDISNKNQSENVLLGVFLALLGTTNVIQELTQVHSVSIQDNANQQENLNNSISQLTYEVLPSNATQNQVTAVDAANQNIQFERSNIQQTVTVLRQTAQGEMQQTTSLTDALQQTTSGTAAVVKLMGTVLELITEISQPKG